MRKPKEIDIQLAKEMFYYDETSTTCLRHKVDKLSGRYYLIVKSEKDSVAGDINSKDDKDYYVTYFNNSLYKCHRIVLALHDIEIPSEMHVDHLNGNKRDNRISNLRVVTVKGNTENRPKQKNNLTGHTGVQLDNNGQGAWYYVAVWNTHKKQYRKPFSIKKLGIMVAFRDAVAHREKMIKELNEQGAGYTERHGK